MPDNTVPAGNLGNMLMNMLYGQQSDPAQQMSDWSNTQQARNRVAAGMDLQGNLLPTPAPGTAPGVGSGQITGAPQDPTAPMAAVQQTGVLPPSQTPNAYKSDQSLGSMIIALQRRQEADAGLNQSLGLAGAAISRPENRERVARTFSVPFENATTTGQMLMNLLSQQQGVDRGNALAQQIYDPQRGPQLAGQLNISWGELQARYQADPVGVGTMIAQYAQPTEAQKNAELATRAYAQANPNASPQDLANYKANLLAGAMGGSDLNQRQYLAEKAQGLTTDDFATWQAKHAAQATAMTTQAKDVQDFKDTAKETFPTLDESYKTQEKSLDYLTDPKNRAAVIKAIQSPELFTTGQAGRWIGGTWAGQALTGVDPAVLSAKGEIEQLKNELFGARFTGTKNVRNLTEANKLQGAATNLFQPTNDAETINRELNRLQDETQRSHATIMAAAGKPIPATYAGKADSLYLDPRSPYYNGTTEEKPPSNGVDTSVRTPADVGRLPKGTRFVIPDGSGRIGVAPGPGG